MPKIDVVFHLAASFGSGGLSIDDARAEVEKDLGHELNQPETSKFNSGYHTGRLNRTLNKIIALRGQLRIADQITLADELARICREYQSKTP